MDANGMAAAAKASKRAMDQNDAGLISSEFALSIVSSSTASHNDMRPIRSKYRAYRRSQNSRALPFHRRHSSTDRASKTSSSLDRSGQWFGRGSDHRLKMPSMPLLDERMVLPHFGFVLPRWKQRGRQAEGAGRRALIKLGAQVDLADANPGLRSAIGPRC